MTWSTYSDKKKKLKIGFTSPLSNVGLRNNYVSLFDWEKAFNRGIICVCPTVRSKDIAILVNQALITVVYP